MSMLPVEYINPFFVATQKICDETIKLQVRPGRPRLREPDERLWKLFPHSALIRLSNAVRGMIGLSFSDSVALALASGLAQQAFKILDEEARDALGEVANLVIGSAKRDLAGGLVEISPPKILLTQQVEFPPDLPTIVLPFESAAGRFMLQLALQQTPPARKAG